MLITETKLDNSFPNAQFLIPNFDQPFYLDIGGGLVVFVRSLILARMLSNYRLPPILFEISLKNEKRLFVSVYKSPSLNNQNFRDSYRTSRFVFKHL